MLTAVMSASTPLCQHEPTVQDETTVATHPIHTGAQNTKSNFMFSESIIETRYWTPRVYQYSFINLL